MNAVSPRPFPLSTFPEIRNQTTLACPRLLCLIFQPLNIGRGIRLIAATGFGGRRSVPAQL